jgi:hypothetical protein
LRTPRLGSERFARAVTSEGFAQAVTSEGFAHAAVDLSVVRHASIAIYGNLDDRDARRSESALEGCAEVFPGADSRKTGSEASDDAAQFRSVWCPEVRFKNFRLHSICNRKIREDSTAVVVEYDDGEIQRMAPSSLQRTHIVEQREIPGEEHDRLGL